MIAQIFVINATFLLIILHGHLWGGRFQMSGVGDAWLPAGMPGILQVGKYCYLLVMEGFWLSDKFLIRADSAPRARLEL
jgi:hypothetical protein